MTREQVSRLKSTPDPLVAPCETGRLASFNGVLSEVAPVPPSARKSRASERPPAQMAPRVRPVAQVPRGVLMRRRERDTSPGMFSAARTVWDVPRVYWGECFLRLIERTQ